MKIKILKTVGYSLFFLTCLVFFLIRGFPLKLVVEDASRAIEQNLGLKMNLTQVSTLFPNGAEATGVRLTMKGREQDSKISIPLERLAGRVSLLGLITGKKDFSFSTNLLSGKVEGRLILNQGDWQVRAQLDGVDLGRLDFWPELIGQDLGGKLSGTLELNVFPREVKSTRGEIALELVQGHVGNGKTYGVNLPLFGLGKTQINLDINKGKVDIKAFKIASDDIEASLDGYFLLQQNLKNISAHCRLRFKASEEKLKEIRQQIPPEFRSLLEGEMAKSLGRDGWHRYSLSGRIFSGKVEWRPLKQ